MADKKHTDYHHGDLKSEAISRAAEMIEAEGYEKVSMRSLAKQIGVSQTALYRHFNDKSELMAAVAEIGFGRLFAYLDKNDQQQTATVTDRFKSLGVAYILFALENPTHYRLMFGGKIANHEAYPGLAEAAKSVFDVLVQAVEAGQIANEFRVGSAHALASVAWAGVHGSAELLLDGHLRSVSEPAAFATYSTDIITAGISK